MHDWTAGASSCGQDVCAGMQDTAAPAPACIWKAAPACSFAAPFRWLYSMGPPHRWTCKEQEDSNGKAGEQGQRATLPLLPNHQQEFGWLSG